MGLVLVVSLLQLPGGLWRALDIFESRHKQQTKDLERIADALEKEDSGERKP